MEKGAGEVVDLWTKHRAPTGILNSNLPFRFGHSLKRPDSLGRRRFLQEENFESAGFSSFRGANVVSCYNTMI